MIRLLSQLWVQPPATCPFRPLARMCAAWADESAIRGCRPHRRIDPGLAKAGIALFRSYPAPRTAGALVARFQEAGT